MSPIRVVELEAFEGPMDGSLLPVYGPECVVKVLERSNVSYRYRMVVDDDGTRFWLFAGVVEVVAA